MRFCALLLLVSCVVSVVPVELRECDLKRTRFCDIEEACVPLDASQIEKRCNATCSAPTSMLYPCRGECVAYADCVTTPTLLTSNGQRLRYGSQAWTSISFGQPEEGLTEDTSFLTVVGYQKERFAFSRSSMVIQLEGTAVSTADNAMYLRYFAEYFAVIGRASFISLSLGEMEIEGRPIPSVTTFDAAAGVVCGDDVHSHYTVGACLSFINADTTKCNESLPASYILTSNAHKSSNLARLVCRKSCNSCPPLIDEDACGGGFVVNTCLHMLKTTSHLEGYCSDTTQKLEYMKDSVCWEALRCRAIDDYLLEHCAAHKCETLIKQPRFAGYTCDPSDTSLFNATQSTTHSAFCVQRITGDPIPGTTVPIADLPLLHCTAPQEPNTHLKACQESIHPPGTCSLTADSAKIEALEVRGVMVTIEPRLHDTVVREVQGKVPSADVTLEDGVLRCYPHIDVGGAATATRQALLFSEAVTLEREVGATLQHLGVDVTAVVSTQRTVYVLASVGRPQRRLLEARFEGQLVVTFTGEHMHHVDGEEEDRTVSSTRVTLQHLGLRAEDAMMTSWGIYEGNLAGRCPVPDEAVWDPYRVGLLRECVKGTNAMNACRIGDMTRKHGSLRRVLKDLHDYALPVHGPASIEGKILVIARGDNVSCAQIRSFDVDAWKRTADTTPESNLTASFSGAPVNGVVSLVDSPYGDAVTEVRLTAENSVPNVSFVVSSRSVAGYAEHCKDFNPSDVFRGESEFDSETPCFDVFANNRFDGCPAGDLNIALFSSIAVPRLVEGAYPFRMVNPYLRVSHLYANMTEMQTLVVLSHGLPIACAPLGYSPKILKTVPDVRLEGEGEEQGGGVVNGGDEGEEEKEEEEEEGSWPVIVVCLGIGSLVLGGLSLTLQCKR